MKVPNLEPLVYMGTLSLSRLQNEGSQLCRGERARVSKSIKATE